MHVLLTGANGFLGSHMTRHLLKNGHTLLAVSRSCGSLTEILDKVTFVSYDSLNIEILQTFSPDIVIHFAWDGGNNYKDVNSANQFDNIKSGVCLLNMLSKLEKRPMFIGVGSFSEYGILSEKAVETQSDSPVTFYGLSKSTFKDVSNRLCQQFDMKWAWVRPCYVYGPNDVKTRLISRVTESLLKQENIQLDSCNVMIDYLYVDDFCRGVSTIAETQHTGVFNVCSGQEYMLRDVLRTLETQIGNEGITFDSVIERKLLSTYVCGNNEKLKSLGWNPTIPLDRGLIEVVRYIKMELFMKTNPVDHDGLHCE
jgi:nucleoside-diphosphate-sugar epimerase